MAYMNQEKKAKIKAALDPIMKEYGIKYSLAVRNHSTLVCNIKSSPIDFIGNYNETVALHVNPRMRNEDNRTKEYIDVNHYWCHEHFSGVALEAIQKIKAAMNEGNHDNSDIQTDYFDVGWYIDINIGQYNKPYELAA